MPFRAAVDEFLRVCAIERQLSRHTLQAYAGDLADFGRRLPPGLPLAEISTDLVKRYLEEMVDGRRLALATVRRRLPACAPSSATPPRRGLGPAPSPPGRRGPRRRHRRRRGLPRGRAPAPVLPPRA